MSYRKTHPWITFELNTRTLGAPFWLALGECRSKCGHLAGVPLKPDARKKLHEVWLAKGVHATAAIEGNSLTEEQVLDRIQNKTKLPESQEYLGREIDNIIHAVNAVVGRISSEGAEPLTVDTVKMYNGQILSDLKTGDHVTPGQFRTTDVGVMDYKAVSWRDCDELMERLCEWLNTGFETEDEDADVTGIIKSIAAHVYIAWIHPFGDGNGRTARLLEAQFMMEAGVPSPAIHLLSNHYNKTRAEYYRRLSESSKNGGNLDGFLNYAVTGLRGLLREQILVTTVYQWNIAWQTYCNEVLGEPETKPVQRQMKLIESLSAARNFIPAPDIPKLNPELAEIYAKVSSKTLTRDIQALKNKGLVTASDEGVRAAREAILKFLPVSRKGVVEKLYEDALKV